MVISREYQFEQYLLSPWNQKQKIKKKHSFSFGQEFFSALGDSPLCGKLRIAGMRKFFFVCAKSWIEPSPLYAILIELKSQDEATVVLHLAPFDTLYLAEEIINVYIPKTNEGTLYMLRSSPFTEDTMQIFHVTSAIGNLVPVANFSRDELKDAYMYLKSPHEMAI